MQTLEEKFIAWRARSSITETTLLTAFYAGAAAMTEILAGRPLLGAGIIDIQAQGPDNEKLNITLTVRPNT